MFEKKELDRKYNCRGFSLNEVYQAKVSELAEILGCSESEIIRRAIDHYYIYVLQEFSKINFKRFR